MQPSRPFFGPDGQSLDTGQLLYEVRPLAKLIAVVGVAALVPAVLHAALVELLSLTPALAVVFAVATQFVLAVGAGVVLMYVVVRAIRLADG